MRTQRGKEEIQAHENTKAKERGKLSAREHEGDKGKSCARKQERGRKHSGALEHGGHARKQTALSFLPFRLPKRQARLPYISQFYLPGAYNPERATSMS